MFERDFAGGFWSFEGMNSNERNLEQDNGNSFDIANRMMQIVDSVWTSFCSSQLQTSTFLRTDEANHLASLLKFELKPVVSWLKI
jgi:hypothetical protein